MKSNAAVTLQFEDFVGNNYIFKDVRSYKKKKKKIVFKKYF